jgi:hypothetical protein
MKPVGLMIGLAAVIGLGVIGYTMLNNRSLISHKDHAYIYFSGDWLVGESKECRQALPLIHLLCGAIPDNQLSTLFNATTKEWYDLRFHSVQVVFWGNPTVNDPDRLFLTWRCERRDSDFKCWRIH